MMFFTWIKRKYKDDTTEKGMLARSIKSDGFYFPKQGRYKKVLKYLHLREADDSYIRAFEECWEEYIEDERKRNRKKTRQRN